MRQYVETVGLQEKITLLFGIRKDLPRHFGDKGSHEYFYIIRKNNLEKMIVNLPPKPALLSEKPSQHC